MVNGMKWILSPIHSYIWGTWIFSGSIFTMFDQYRYLDLIFIQGWCLIFGIYVFYVLLLFSDNLPEEFVIIAE